MDQLLDNQSWQAGLTAVALMAQMFVMNPWDACDCQTQSACSLTHCKHLRCLLSRAAFVQSGTDWVACGHCHRWQHVACDPRSDVGNFKQLAESGEAFTCVDCSKLQQGGFAPDAAQPDPQALAAAGQEGMAAPAMAPEPGTQQLWLPEAQPPEQQQQQQMAPQQQQMAPQQPAEQQGLAEQQPMPAEQQPPQEQQQLQPLQQQQAQQAQQQPMPAAAAPPLQAQELQPPAPAPMPDGADVPMQTD